MFRVLSMLRGKPTEEKWRSFLTGESRILQRGRHLLGALPSRERCKNCNAPFTGPAGMLMRLIGRARYNRNPRFCTF